LVGHPERRRLHPAQLAGGFQGLIKNKKKFPKTNSQYQNLKLKKVV